jgi:succinate-semialdehyde dehydrogenase/glutarate-semialdehyde dehydrogenase
VGPALAAGCAVVCKPAAETPLSALALAVLAAEAGVPPGVFNVITTSDSKAVGKELCENPVVRKLSFTGSTEVGRILMAQCAGTIKKLSLELGGNAPFIVFDDADIDKAVDYFMSNKFRGAGQTCVCANRVYVQTAVAAAFSAKLAERVNAIKVGNGMEPGVDMGPLIDRKAFDKVRRHVDGALAGGAQRIAGSEPVEPSDHDGCFFPPTVLRGVTPQME